MLFLSSGTAASSYNQYVRLQLQLFLYVQGDGSTITVEPGLIGGEINRILARHKAKHNHPIQYKIGPDPSSIDSCMVGGMVSNNSSGMCCGVSQNTYHTLKDMRIVFLDGTVLDTSNASSREAFLQVMQSHRCPDSSNWCYLAAWVLDN